MTRLSAILALLAAPVSAESLYVWKDLTALQHYSDSTLEIHAPTHPDAVATVSFANTEVHMGEDSATLTYDSPDGPIEVTVFFEMNAQGADDKIEVLPPDGFLAIPQTLLVPERATGVVHIVEWEGV